MILNKVWNFIIKYKVTLISIVISLFVILFLINKNDKKLEMIQKENKELIKRNERITENYNIIIGKLSKEQKELRKEQKLLFDSIQLIKNDKKELIQTIGNLKYENFKNSKAFETDLDSIVFYLNEQYN